MFCQRKGREETGIKGWKGATCTALFRLKRHLPHQALCAVRILRSSPALQRPCATTIRTGAAIPFGWGAKPQKGRQKCAHSPHKTPFGPSSLANPTRAARQKRKNRAVIPPCAFYNNAYSTSATMWPPCLPRKEMPTICGPALMATQMPIFPTMSGLWPLYCSISC